MEGHQSSHYSTPIHSPQPNLNCKFSLFGDSSNSQNINAKVIENRNEDGEEANLQIGEKQMKIGQSDSKMMGRQSMSMGVISWSNNEYENSQKIDKSESINKRPQQCSLGEQEYQDRRNKKLPNLERASEGDSKNGRKISINTNDNKQEQKQSMCNKCAKNTKEKAFGIVFDIMGKVLNKIDQHFGSSEDNKSEDSGEKDSEKQEENSSNDFDSILEGVFTDQNEKEGDESQEDISFGNTQSSCFNPTPQQLKVLESIVNNDSQWNQQKGSKSVQIMSSFRICNEKMVSEDQDQVSVQTPFFRRDPQIQGSSEQKQFLQYLQRQKNEAMNIIMNDFFKKAVQIQDFFNPKNTHIKMTFHKFVANKKEKREKNIVTQKEEVKRKKQQGQEEKNL